MKLQRCWALTRYPILGTWYRAVRAHHGATPLAYHHTTTRSGRFHNGSEERPGISAIYLTDDPQVTLYEVRAMIGSLLPGLANAPSPNPVAWTLLPVSVTLLIRCGPDARLRVADRRYERSGTDR